MLFSVQTENSNPFLSLHLRSTGMTWSFLLKMEVSVAVGKGIWSDRFLAVNLFNPWKFQALLNFLLFMTCYN